MVHLWTVAEPEGGARGAPAPLTPRKISYCNLKGLKQEKERKKNDS